MTPAEEPPPFYRSPAAERRIALIAQSYRRLLGRDLVPGPDDVLAALWRAPFAILAHGTEADPVFFFGNRAALRAFECDADTFVQMPSRLSAEAPLREQRQALLDRVTQDGFITDYAGIRISAKGRRFRISGATVWNLMDSTGARFGQAACFAV